MEGCFPPRVYRSRKLTACSKGIGLCTREDLAPLPPKGGSPPLQREYSACCKFCVPVLIFCGKHNIPAHIEVTGSSLISKRFEPSRSNLGLVSYCADSTFRIIIRVYL